jgi:hypothetical protein
MYAFLSLCTSILVSLTISENIYLLHTYYVVLFQKSWGKETAKRVLKYIKMNIKEIGGEDVDVTDLPQNRV